MSITARTVYTLHNTPRFIESCCAAVSSEFLVDFCKLPGLLHLHRRNRIIAPVAVRYPKGYLTEYVFI